MNEFENRYFPLKRKFSNRVKKFSRDRELRFERIKIPGFLLEVKRLILPAPVKNAAGKRLAFVSDWHWHGSRRNFRLLDEFSEVLKRFPVDFLLSGGDICDDGEHLKTLPPLLARMGEAAPQVLAVNGNWETGKRWLRQDFFADLLAENRIKLLENNNFTAAGFNIWGLPDISSIDFRNLPPPELSKEEFNILLTHSPDAVIAADKGAFLKDFNLAFCGHTHGGQVRIPFIGALYCPSFYRCKFDRGIYLRQGNNFKMIVSSGIGEHNHTRRLFCPPEMILLELR